MSAPRRGLAAWTWVCLLVACGEAPRLELEVLSAERRSSGQLAVVASLRNAAGPSVDVDPAHFEVLSLDAQRVLGSTTTGDDPEGCGTPGRSAIASGEQLTCVVLFDASADLAPVQLVFESAGRRATAPIGSRPGPDPADRDSGTGPTTPLTRDLDILFMVDNSNSMAEEQASLVAAFPRLFAALATGDLDQDGAPDALPFESIHAGVVTSDMGTAGYPVPTCNRPDFGDDGVLRTVGRTDDAGCMAVYPSFLSFQAGVSPMDFGEQLGCVARTGTSGCGFEQQLEAVLKALSPSVGGGGTAPGYVPPSFFRGTPGHADLGFLRDGSLLAVVLVTDEEDCSAFDGELFNQESTVYTTDLNLRCFTHANEALHPLSRYVQGLLQARPEPSRVVYALIAGVPVGLTTSREGTTDWDRLIGTVELRDPRMVEQIDPSNPNRLIPSCDVPGRGVAFAPVRLAGVGQGLQAGGAAVTIESICQADLSSVIDGVVRTIYSRAP